MRSVFLGLVGTCVASLFLGGCSAPDLAPLQEELDRHVGSLPADLGTRRLSADDAVALAIRFNLDARVKAAEVLIAAGKADLSNFALLPELAAKGVWSSRSPAKITTSEDVASGAKGGSYSRGDDPRSLTADLTGSWNLMDFGIALLRSEQESGRVQLAFEKRRRALHLLVQDVYAAYWKAVVNEYAARKFESLEVKLRKSAADADTAERTRVGDPMQMLAHQRAIADTMRQIAELQRQTSTARAELAGLMGVPSVAAFQLAELGDASTWEVVEPAADMVAMEQAALADRPELKSEEAQYRIDAEDVHVELLKSIPGIGPFFGGHYDTNSFLLHNVWSDAGVRVSWNLIDLVSMPSRMSHARSTAELTRTKRMAVAMAVLTQVHVADIQYRHALKEYRLTETMARLDQRIADLAGKAKKTGSGSAMEEIKAEATGMLSALRRYLIYSDLQAAKARLKAAVGADPAQPESADGQQPGKP